MDQVPGSNPGVPIGCSPMTEQEEHFTDDMTQHVSDDDMGEDTLEFPDEPVEAMSTTDSFIQQLLSDLSGLDIVTGLSYDEVYNDRVMVEVEGAPNGENDWTPLLQVLEDHDLDIRLDGTDPHNPDAGYEVMLEP